MPNCRDCKEPIKFAKLTGWSIPVNAMPSFDGGFVLFHESGVLSARAARLPQDYNRPRHRFHFDFCKSRRHRKDRLQ